MHPTIKLSRTGPGIGGFVSNLARATGQEVLVGIPAKNNPRKGEKIGNAALLWIHAHGSPMQHIPPRPVLEPAISADGNRQAIAKELALAVKEKLAGNNDKALEHLKLAGTLGQNFAQAWFFDARNNWAPNKPATIARKHSDQPLIDSGDMRKAIVYVIRDVVR